MEILCLFFLNALLNHPLHFLLQLYRKLVFFLKDQKILIFLSYPFIKFVVFFSLFHFRAFYSCFFKRFVTFIVVPFLRYYFLSFFIRVLFSFIVCSICFQFYQCNFLLSLLYLFCELCLYFTTCLPHIVSSIFLVMTRVCLLTTSVPISSCICHAFRVFQLLSKHGLFGSLFFYRLLSMFPYVFLASNLPRSRQFLIFFYCTFHRLCTIFIVVFVLAIFSNGWFCSTFALSLSLVFLHQFR